jgi:hypothetical protein
MKTPTEVITEENRRVVRAQNRPDIRDDRPKGVLFSTEGSTWWGRVRNIRGHKGTKNEGDFSHLHDKFTEEEA